MEIQRYTLRGGSRDRERGMAAVIPESQQVCWRPGGTGACGNAEWPKIRFSNRPRDDDNTE